MVVYILPGYVDHGAILSRLGAHRLGKSYLNLASLARVDQDALADLIRAGPEDLAPHWPVLPA